MSSDRYKTQFQSKILRNQDEIFDAYDTQDNMDVSIHSISFYRFLRWDEYCSPSSDEIADLSNKFEVSSINYNLIHPNLVEEYSSFSKNLRGYIVMERLPPHTLEDLLRNKSLSIQSMYKIFLDVVYGLQHLQEIGMIRYIQPQYVYVGDCAKIFGSFGYRHFGSSFLSAQETPYPMPNLPYDFSYFPTELIMGEEDNIKSSIFSLGVMFYKGLCKTFPHRTSPLFRKEHDVVPAKQFCPSIPESFNDLITRMLSNIPEERPDLCEISKELSELV